MLRILLPALALSVGFNVALFLIAYRYKTDRLTDASYALTFIALALYAFWHGPGVQYQQLAVFMVLAWALRLGGFLLFRIWRTKTDKHFDGIREDFWKFGTFWLVQGLSVWLILLPTILFLSGTDNINFTHAADAGAGLWLIGLLLESVADLQKYRFSRNPANKEKWIAEGVWRWSRHPNYFGEMLVWVGMWLVTTGSFTTPVRAACLVNPLFIILLLRFASGVPPLEKSADARWGSLPAYRVYKRHTNLLIPWPPKK